jgi:hypothetical protein
MTQDGRHVAGIDAAYQVCLELANCVVNNVRYRCEVGHRLQKEFTVLAQQATSHHALAQAHSSPSTASLPDASSAYSPGYAAGYAAGCASYGNATDNCNAYYARDVTPQYQQQALSQYSSPATTAHYPLCTTPTTPFTPTCMTPQVAYGSRSPAAYELQMLAVQSPQVHVVTPQRVYANPRMAVSAAQQAGYLSGPLLARPLGAFQPQQVGQYVPQPQYTSQAQYALQPQYVQQPQYSCQYVVPSTVTPPPQAYPEIGLRARSYTEGSDRCYHPSAPLSPTHVMVSSPRGTYADAPQMVQTQPAVYYVAQQQPAAQAPQVMHPYVTAPAAPVSTTGSTPEVPQEEEEDPATQSPRSSVSPRSCCSCSCSERSGVHGSRAQQPSPAFEGQRMLRFPQVGGAALPAVVYAASPVPQYVPMSSQSVY